MNDNSIKRVLHVVSDMHRGGAETMIMNLYRNIDRSKLQFDFICHYIKGDVDGINKRADYYDEIEKLGGRIFKVPSLGTSNPIEYTLNIKKVINKNGPFKAIHVHTNKQSGFALLGARLAGIKNRIIHSHTTEWVNFNKIYISTLKFIMKSNATKYCACGVDAGVNAFDIKDIDNSEVNLLSNAIDINNFINVDRSTVNKLKHQLDINDETKIIGHIGRFSEEKNHKFIIQLAKELNKNNRDFVILLIGTGPLENEIKSLIRENNLNSNVKILGVREDIDILMNLFDVFILPSVFEGLPLVTVEAQSAGTRCIVSDSVSNEVDMGLGLVKQLPIHNESLDKWESEIFDEQSIELSKEEILEKITLKGYNVKQNVNKLYELYEI